ncbi:S8 family serine peptidase [Kribbella sp. NPDC051952]|uniref:S8 family peptidase n=1 Tax=Kribbella sp. NPDC051952 TaxID=3154851 RepID=UPI00341F0427
MHIRPGPRWIAAVVLTLSAGLITQHPAGPAHASPTKNTQDRGVTLITGDRVVLVGGDVTKPRIEPGPGRRNIPYRTLYANGGLTVIPADVAADVAAGTLDRRLFEIGTLLDDHYDDASTPSIPLIVTYAGRAAAHPALSKATTTHELPSVNGRAVKVTKKDAGAFLAGLRTARSSGPAKIWLDGKRKVSLDQSVPQIGAPEAWKAGYTGKGVKIAVLDTGVDSTHPDLSTQVAETRNFTDGPPEDQIGHGTHVASTIAGTGAASGGKYRGVAPDARLYAGKVCIADCLESSILAGMEWAATEVHATAVNLSLGGPNAPETDPLEEAVSRLTAETGTLFVIAAGNSGPRAGTVESPGSAEAALTVGAVDKQDRLADFSSRGPGLGDGAIKPDVTAPGVAITAARPLNKGVPPYQSMSGTSMATPHTAGAIALLAQEHPDWRAAELKAALMTSAKQLPGLTPFEQGAGRIDVGQATRQTLIAAPATVSFGTAVWPHQDDAPVTKTVTYRNTATQPVTLQLTTTFTGPDGRSAPADALRVSASTLTVPAGGTASVELTSDTRHNGPDGAYSGSLAATSPSGTVTSLLTLNKEVESYDLTVHSVGPSGQQADSYSAIYGIDTGQFEVAAIPGGTLTRRLPKGRYLIDNYQYYPQPDGRTPVYLMLSPNTAVTAATAVTFDARTSKPYDVTVPEPEAAPLFAEVHYEITRPNTAAASIITYRPDDLYTAQVGTPSPAGELRSWLASSWVKFDAFGHYDETPFLYHTMDPTLSGFPTGLARTVRPGDLAVIDQEVYRASSDQDAVTLLGSVAGSRFWTAEQVPPIYTVPAKRKVYVDTGQAVWSTVVDELRAPWAGSVVSPATAYGAGNSYRQPLDVAVFAPAPDTATRSGDTLNIVVDPTSDATGAAGTTMADTESTLLFKDGQKVASSPTFGSLKVVGLAAGNAQYVVEAALTRPTYSSYSTRISGRWSFSSSAAQEVLPVLGIRYQPPVDVNNTVARTPVTRFPVVVVPQHGVSLPGLSDVTVQYSADDGTTWQAATLRSTGSGRYEATFPTPKDGDAVSLKTKVTDRNGNTSELTTIAAYFYR